jgi:hypothetical protein
MAGRAHQRCDITLYAQTGPANKKRYALNISMDIRVSNAHLAHSLLWQACKVRCCPSSSAAVALSAGESALRSTRHTLQAPSFSTAVVDCKPLTGS